MIKSSIGQSFGDRAIDFYSSLVVPEVPSDIEAIHPMEGVRAPLLMEFLEKYYSDSNSRILVLGINPGRLGGAATGISFTDPIALADDCGISHELPRRREISSQFIYEVIAALGGPFMFFDKFFLSAVCPIGLTSNGSNVNYYDFGELRTALQETIVESLKKQFEMGCSRDVAVLIGSGNNRSIFANLNDQYKFVRKTMILEHPRFILQYKRKHLASFKQKYISTLTSAVTMQCEA